MMGVKMRRLNRRAAKNRMLGQSMVEYFVVTAFTVIILIEGADSSAIQSVVTAIKEAYEGFSYAMGFSSNLNAL
jgi:hypothetical protein